MARDPITASEEVRGAGVDGTEEAMLVAVVVLTKPGPVVIVTGDPVCVGSSGALLEVALVGVVPLGALVGKGGEVKVAFVALTTDGTPVVGSDELGAFVSEMGEIVLPGRLVAGDSVVVAAGIDVEPLLPAGADVVVEGKAGDAVVVVEFAIEVVVGTIVGTEAVVEFG